MGKSAKKSHKRTRFERSAGIVVFRDHPDASGGHLFLLLDYGRHWDYAKGHVKPGESDRDAAIRELIEETGIDHVQFIDGFEQTIAYFFQHPKRGLVRKTVIFYLARTTTAKVHLSEEHVGYAWLPGPDALDRLTFETARTVMRAAIAFLDSHP